VEQGDVVAGLVAQHEAHMIRHAQAFLGPVHAHEHVAAVPLGIAADPDGKCQRFPENTMRIAVGDHLLEPGQAPPSQHGRIVEAFLGFPHDFLDRAEFALGYLDEHLIRPEAHGDQPVPGLFHGRESVGGLVVLDVGRGLGIGLQVHGVQPPVRPPGHDVEQGQLEFLALREKMVGKTQALGRLIFVAAGHQQMFFHGCVLSPPAAFWGRRLFLLIRHLART